MKAPTPTRAATDFASAAMVRVLAQGMRDLGMDPAQHAPRSAGHGATVSLDEKRQLVGAALAQGGIGCLALLGRGLHRYADEPTHRALVSARDVQDLLTRWVRLERYIHSRHRIEVLSLSHRSARIAHLSRPGFPPPLPVENLVVLGLLVALLEAIGATGVTARIEDVPVYPLPDPTALATVAQRRGTNTWGVDWAAMNVSSWQLATDPVQLPTLIPPAAWPTQAQRSLVLLCANLMRPLTLPDLAQALGEAPRSLQRSLSRAGLSYTQLLAEARCRSASWWLMKTVTPVAEVGFVSGYADQPHFTRDFRNRVGMTPLRYRNEFSATA